MNCTGEETMTPVQLSTEEATSSDPRDCIGLFAYVIRKQFYSNGANPISIKFTALKRFLGNYVFVDPWTSTEEHSSSTLTSKDDMETNKKTVKPLIKNSRKKMLFSCSLIFVDKGKWLKDFVDEEKNEQKKAGKQSCFLEGFHDELDGYGCRKKNGVSQRVISGSHEENDEKGKCVNEHLKVNEEGKNTTP
uniref:Ulp1 protease family, C-terminal catalytic domain-containing protein n=1 Tax=Angiostrongylus cantonensis TaxID=6313 RepID=A0A0K0CTV7_ANGCA